MLKFWTICILWDMSPKAHKIASIKCMKNTAIHESWKCSDLKNQQRCKFSKGQNPRPHRASSNFLYVGWDVRVKFGDPRSNGSRDILGAGFVSNERTLERTKQIARLMQCQRSLEYRRRFRIKWRGVSPSPNLWWASCSSWVAQPFASHHLVGLLLLASPVQLLGQL